MISTTLLMLTLAQGHLTSEQQKTIQQIQDYTEANKALLYAASFLINTRTKSDYCLEYFPKADLSLKLANAKAKKWELAVSKRFVGTIAEVSLLILKKEIGKSVKSGFESKNYVAQDCDSLVDAITNKALPLDIEPYVTEK